MPELAAFFGLKAVPLDDPDPAAAKLRKEKEELKEALVDALARKVHVCALWTRRLCQIGT